MTGLKKILDFHLNKTGKLGISAIDTTQLKEEIRQVSKTNQVYAVFTIVTLFLIVAGTAIWISFFFDGEPSQAAKGFGITGVTLGAVITLLMKIWRQKFVADLTLAFVASLKGEITPSVLEIIYKKL
jgi:hypothetical protein